MAPFKSKPKAFECYVCHHEFSKKKDGSGMYKEGQYPVLGRLVGADSFIVITCKGCCDYFNKVY